MRPEGANEPGKRVSPAHSHLFLIALGASNGRRSRYERWAAEAEGFLSSQAASKSTRRGGKQVRNGCVTAVRPSAPGVGNGSEVVCRNL